MYVIVTNDLRQQRWRKFFYFCFFLVCLFLGVTTYHMYQQSEYQELLHLRKQNKIIETTVAELKESNRLMTADLEVRAQTETVIQNENKMLHEQIYQLKKDISLYQKIMASTTLKQSGIKIAKVELKPGVGEGHYQFQLVLTQENSEHKLAEGVVIGKVVGKLDSGKQGAISLSKVVSKPEVLKYKFRYFQVIEGEMVLPLHFIPDALQFEVTAAGAEQKQVMQSFHWSVKEAIYHVEEQSREEHRLS